MAESYYTILTSIGKAQIANSLGLGTKIDFVKMKIGDGNGSYYNPTESQLDLVHTVWEGAIGNVAIDEQNSNWINIEVLIPPDVGGFFIREYGVFDANNNMLAIAKCAETYKPLPTDGSTKEINMKMVLAITNTSSITLKIDPTIMFAKKSEVETVKNQVNTISTEVQNARGTYQNLKARLDANDTSLLDMKNEITTDYVYNSALTDLSFNSNQLMYFYRAILKGNCKIAFVGDSITEGINCNEHDRYTSRVTEKIKSIFPTVNFTIKNFAIEGTGIVTLNDSNFIASNTTPQPTNTFWRDWATNGKSWIQHIIDFSPDLLFVAFGMNDSGIGVDLNNTNLANLLTKVKSLMKSDLILINSMLPTLKKPETYNIENYNKIAQSYRTFSKLNNIPLIDSNRLSNILVRGKDICSTMLINNIETPISTNVYYKDETIITGGTDNHPNPLGHYLVYYNAFNSLFKNIDNFNRLESSLDITGTWLLANNDYVAPTGKDLYYKIIDLVYDTKNNCSLRINSKTLFLDKLNTTINGTQHITDDTFLIQDWNATQKIIFIAVDSGTIPDANSSLKYFVA